MICQPKMLGHGRALIPDVGDTCYPDQVGLRDVNSAVAFGAGGRALRCVAGFAAWGGCTRGYNASTVRDEKSPGVRFHGRYACRAAGKGGRKLSYALQGSKPKWVGTCLGMFTA